MLGEPAGIAGGGGSVAADHDHGARGHFGNGGQRGFVAALARRIHNDYIGAGPLGSQLGRSGTGILAAEVCLFCAQSQPCSGLLGTFHSLGHDLDANKALAEYKDTDIDGLRKSAEEWQAKAEQAEKDADARVAAVQFDAKLDSAIAAAHGRSGKAIRALLDLDALRGSEDPDKDIPAALSALQKDSGYMFDTEETPPPYAAGTGRTAMTTDNSDSALRKAMGLPME